MLEDNQTVGTQYLNGILEADGKKSLALGGCLSSPPVTICTYLPSCPPPTRPLGNDIPRPSYTECQQILKQKSKQ